MKTENKKAAIILTIVLLVIAAITLVCYFTIGKV